MNIAILTQPMSANYGCNLQAFALQTVIRRLGHEVVILDRWRKRQKKPLLSCIKSDLITIVKNIIKLCIFKPVYCTITEDKQAYFWKNIIRFQAKYLTKSHQLYSTEDINKYVNGLNIDCYIVGSDQVWRPKYNLDGMLENMFLDFTNGLDVKRIAYAASFGVDQWEYSDEQTNSCRELAKAFDAISVREHSGIQLCQMHLGVSATNVLDPTMLLSSADYDSLVGNQIPYINGDLFCYILDQSSTITTAINAISQKEGLTPYTCLNSGPEGGYKLFHRSQSILPSVEQWIYSFKKAKAVIVDSFHGAVFSIIYNKPFWVIGNPKRGMARFDSLLNMFDLQSRIITIDRLSQIDVFSPIDWDSVNEKLSDMQVYSIQFLKDSLSN